MLTWQYCRYTDNTGIANSVSCGNTKILASILSASDLIHLFAPDDGPTQPGYNVEPVVGVELGRVRTAD